MTTLQLAERLGSQTPRIENVPPWVTSSGQEAIELAEMAGLVLDPWQRHVLMGGLGQHASGRWSAAELAMVVPRQNGKGGILEAIVLPGMYLFGEQVVYTAHLMSTSRKMRQRIQDLIEATPDLDREVKQIRVSNEEQSVELKSRARVDFVARSLSSARGWSGDRTILDEAFALMVEHVGALMPILFARQNWQLVYASSAGMVGSHALRQVRQRGIAGDPDLAYYEWSVDEELYRANPEAVAVDEDAWAQANPALGIRISRDTLAKAQRSMDPAEFAREVLGVWDDAQGTPVIDLGVWARLADPASQLSDPVVFALDANPEHTWGSIAAAGDREDGIAHVEIVARQPGVDWMVARAVELEARWSPSAWMLDPGGPAGALLTDLQEAGIEPKLVTGREMAQACGAFVAAAVATERDQLRHLGQPSLEEAIRAAQKRTVGEAWAWGRKLSTEDISPLVAATLALHGLAVHGVDVAGSVW